MNLEINLIYEYNLNIHCKLWQLLAFITNNFIFIFHFQIYHLIHEGMPCQSVGGVSVRGHSDEIVNNIMQVLYWSELSFTALLSGCLIFLYSHHKAALYARFLAFASVLCSLLCFAILPIDIYQSAEQDDALPDLQRTWTIVYYVNFFLCWLVLPLALEFEDSGEFTVGRRAREAVVSNALMIGVMVGGAVVVVVLLVASGGFSFSQLPSVFATLANSFGLALVAVFLGYGLVSFPKECWLRRDYKKLVAHCHRQAQAIREQQQGILEEVFSIRSVLQRNDLREISEKRLLFTLIQQNFKFQNFVASEQGREQLAKKSTGELHKILKRRVLERQANDSYLDELVDELKGTTESYLANNYSHKRMAFTACFALTLLLSLLVFFAELATFAPFLEPANLLALLSRSGIAGLVLNTCLAGYVAYVITHTVFRIRIYKAFALHRGHSSASSLLFTAINLARVSYPLCFNYLQMAGLPDSAFLRFFGELTLHRGIFLVFPLLMLLFAGLNLFDVFEKVIGCLGLGSFAFDAEQAQEKEEEGRNILIERLRERNIENNHLEMIQLL